MIALFKTFKRSKDTPEKIGKALGKEYYNNAFSQAEHWQAHYTKSNYYFIWTVILDRLRRIKPAEILEIGCGPGQLASAIHDAGLAPRYIGLDFSKVALSFARRACPSHFVFIETNATQSDIYFTAEYDTVISTEFLEHVEADVDVLSKIRSGTRLIATVPNFPYVSHVRHFQNAASVADRYANLFRDLSVTAIPGIQQDTCFYLMEGEKR